MLVLKVDLPDEIQAELDNSEFASRIHYSRATYALGCRGPLCRKAERDRGRKRNERRAKDKEREYKPNEDLRIADDEKLNEIIEWHRNQKAAVA